MRSIVGGLLILPFLAMPAVAQQAAGQGVTLDPSGASGTSRTCVEVEIAGQKASGFDCLNRQLKQEVQNVQPTATIAPIDASSPAVKVGGFNAAAMSEQYGRNWGKSVVPYRPPAPVYASPLH